MKRAAFQPDVWLRFGEGSYRLAPWALIFGLLAVWFDTANAAESDREALVAYFSQADSYYQPSLAPGEGSLAYWRMAGQHPQLVVQGLDATSAHQPALFDLPEGLMNWFQWLDDRRLIVSQTLIEKSAPSLTGDLSRRKRKGQRANTGLSRTFYLADLQTGALTAFLTFPLNHRFANGSDDFLSRLPDDPDRFLVAFPPEGGSFPGVYKVHVETGEAEVVAAPQEPIEAWSVDQDFNLRLAIGWGNDGQHIKIRPQPDGPWRDLSDHALFKSGRFGVLGFSEDGEDLYLRSSLGKGRSAIYRFNLQTGMIREKLFEHPKYDAGSIMLAQGGKLVLAATFVDDVPRMVPLNVSFGEQLRAITDRLGSDNFLITDIGESGSKWLITLLHADVPESLYLYEPEAGIFRLLMKRLSGVMPQAGKTRAVSYFSRDGLEIPAYLTLPYDRQDGETTPMIVMPHGGPQARDMMLFDAWAQYFASIGYGVLKPNFRGSTGYGDIFEISGYGEWGQAMQDDVSDGADWLVREGYADKDKLCIMGASYGGYAALMAAIRTDGRFQCAVALAPVADLPLWLEMVATSKAERKAMLWRTAGAERLKDARRQSPVHLVKQVNLPILLGHGMADIRVAPAHSLRMAAALTKRKKDFTPLWLEGGSHFLLQPGHREAVLRAATEFIERHIGGH